MLPDFDQPPVTEVIIGIQNATTQFSNVHAGMFYERMKKRFPKVSEQDPLAAIFETFGPNPVQSGFHLQFGRTPTRYWFVTEDDCELIQIQNDRFLHNWRQTQASDRYPRFKKLFSEFVLELDAWQKFLQDQNIGDLSINQVEVTYINHIYTEGEGNPYAYLGDVFRFWAKDMPPQEGFPFDNATGSVRFLLQDEEGAPYGRLHAEFLPAFHNETQRAAIQFQLTARAKPKQDTVDAARATIEKCHEAIVKSFAGLTTAKMHELWGLKNVSD